MIESREKFFLQEISNRFIYILGNSLLLIPNLQIQEKIDFSYEDGNYKSCQIYVGELKLDEATSIRVLFSDLSDSNKEYIIAYNTGNNPIYTVYKFNDEASFLCAGQKLQIIDQISNLVALESLFKAGLFWKPCENYQDLYDYVKKYLNEVN